MAKADYVKKSARATANTVNKRVRATAYAICQQSARASADYVNKVHAQVNKSTCAARIS
jgi:hypothetical protein